MSIIVILLVLAAGFYIFSNISKASTASDPQKRTSGGNYGKWVGGGIGWAFGGPIGALAGFMFGGMFDGERSPRQGGHPYQQRNGTSTGFGDFSMSLLVLSAAVMKADGVVKKSELEYVKRFFASNFGEEKSQQLILALRELLKKDINIQEVSVQISNYMDYASRLQLLHYLFGISQSDGHIDSTEIDIINTISRFLRLSTADFQSVKAMFVKDTHSAYKILEVSSSATDEELKKAYKKMAIKYHPDKVSHLGVDVQKAAEDKFQILNAAYEGIKKARGIR